MNDTTIDTVTGLCNQRALLPLLSEALRHSQRYQEPLTTVLLRIESFSALQLRHGSLAIDDALHTLVERLRQSLRQTDILARYSEDTLCILLPLTARHDAITLIGRLCGQVARAPCDGISLTLSAGIAVMGAQPASLLQRAHEALRVALAKGRSIATDAHDSPAKPGL